MASIVRVVRILHARVAEIDVGTRGTFVPDSMNEIYPTRALRSLAEDPAVSDEGRINTPRPDVCIWSRDRG